ncbi:MAG: hypothetical protein K8T10_05525 [Candidatus Eremiobacteraeota bacterium]|nr:hypothetical protein [Candidatus Eremiobacteraeota bacterium]
MSKTKILIISLVLLFSAFALFHLIGCGGSSSSDEPSPSPTVSPTLFFAAFHPVDGHLINALQADGVSISQVSEDHTITYDALVINGNEFESKDIKSSQIIKKYLDNDKGVLLINASTEDRQALREHIGISFGDHTSQGFFVAALPNTYGREFVIIDHPREFSLQASDMSAMSDESTSPLDIDEEQLQENQDAFEEEMRTNIGPSKLAKAIVKRLLENKKLALEGTSRDVEPPQELKYRKWYVDQTESPMTVWKYDTAWVWYNPDLQFMYPSNSPMWGWQQGTYGHTTLITLYLDNDPNNMGKDFQWLTIDHQGWWDTVDGDNHTNDGAGIVEMPLSKDKDIKYSMLSYEEKKYYGWGWGVMAYYFKFQPPGNEITNFKYVKGIPLNQITNTTISESASLNVGFSRSGVSSSFTVNKSISNSVPSWEVDVASSPGASSFFWLWHSNDPDWEKNKINGFNTLIKDGYEPAAYGILQTLSVLDRTITFDMGYGVNKFTTAAHYVPLSQHARFDIDKVNDFQYDIDFGAVLYPLVQELTISPSTVVGGNTTTGTVTLDQIAPAGGVEVELSSNNTGWATVPETVIVPEGVGAQTFKITTYSITGNSVVTITATTNRVEASADLTVREEQ